MNSILINDDNLMVFQPKLAKFIGINEVIILNQIHYWLEKKKNIIEEKSWVYNSYEDWQKQICFLSVSTIKKSIKKLESTGIVISSNFNRSKIDKTKWYTIDYAKLQDLYQKAENNSGDETSISNDVLVDERNDRGGIDGKTEEISNVNMDTESVKTDINDIMIDKK